MIKMKVTFTDDEGHRRRSKVTKNELMVISHILLHSQKSYLVISRVYFRARSSVNDLLKSEMTDSFNLKSVSDL